MLSLCLALPRQGHLKQFFRVLSYLEMQYNYEMAFDHTVPDINRSGFPKEDWDNTVYSNERGELKEHIPTNLPTSLGKGFVCVCILV